MPFRTHDPRLLRTSLLCFAVALASLGAFACANDLVRGPVVRNGPSNGPENDGKTGFLNPFAFEYLATSNIPVRKDGTSHPIIGGDAATGFITKGIDNARPDKTLLTLANYSGFVLLTPGLDWRGMR